ncbi:MAG: protein translocase subunit SecF [Acutalibacteraceae bacterium]|nr:protein translocase subunit SecF [Acutalibacteraceae bacterium]
MTKNFDFNKPLKWVLIAYAALALVGIVIGILFGVKLDTNFKGGTVITYDYTYSDTVADISADDVKAIVTETFGMDSTVSKGSSIAGNTYTFTVTLAKNEAVTTDNQESLATKLQEKYPDNNIALYSSTSVNATLATSFFLKALAAVLVVAILVVVYVGIRFKKIGGVTAALTALAALVLDVAVSFVACVVFRLQIDMNYIAVVLTILGYSLNDTIVVYDSVRENKKYNADMKLYDVVNKSLGDVLARNIVTTSTTVIAVITIIVVAELFGLTSLRTFAIPMVFGLISGCISSIFVSTPLWVVWKNKLKAKKK